MQSVDRGWVNSCAWELFRGGAAPYTLYLDGRFYCTCDNRKEVDEELEEIAQKLQLL